MPKIKVTLKNPVIYCESLAQAEELLKIANYDGTITFEADEAAPVVKGTKAKQAATQPKRKRRTKAEMARAAAAEEKPAAAVDRKSLTKAFSTLVETDYDTAAGLLERFGVDRFSALPDDKLAEFAAAMAA